MKIIESMALISINETMVFQLLSFLIFLFILHRIMIRPLNRVMEERTRFLERIEEQIADTEEEYDEICGQIVHQEAQARDAAFKIRDDIEAAGRRSAEELMAETREEINRLKVKSQQETADQMAVAREQMRNQAGSIADRMISVLLGRKVGLR